MYRRFREQVRSHGLRPESKTDVCITLSAEHRHDSQTQESAMPGRALSDPSAKTQQNVAQSPRKMAHWRAPVRVTHLVIIRTGRTANPFTDKYHGDQCSARDGEGLDHPSSQPAGDAHHRCRCPRAPGQ
ncbi:hypothetical protein GE543_10840 [Pseudomonas sp. SZ57]|nr:hypothetical protein [Pseudomonas sp. SZ57]